jgi:DUF1365 family protein
MKSCIYEGQVRHRRFAPKTHEFNYRLFMMYVDLQELPVLFEKYWLWSAKGFNLAWFKRNDHVGDSASSLDEVVRDRVEEASGSRPQGPIRLLTHFRYFGFCFNPVSFYYCFDQSGEQLETIVCEVNNTPWGEQHLYVLDEKHNNGTDVKKRYQRSKAFHVSPFMPMDIEYDWLFSLPADRLNVHMRNFKEQEKLFDATLTLEQKSISSFNLARILLSYPVVTMKVVAAIYFEAARLWLKKTPFYSHPDSHQNSGEAKSL